MNKGKREELLAYQHNQNSIHHILGAVAYLAIPNSMLICFAVSMAFSGSYEAFLSLLLCIGGLVVFFDLPIAAYFYHQWKFYERQALLIYDGGIGVDDGYDYYFVEWNNIKSIELDYQSRASGAGIRLKTPVIIESRFARFKYLKKIEFIAFNQQFIHVPIYTQISFSSIRKVIDMEAFGKTEFGQYLLKFAPHLFE